MKAITISQPYADLISNLEKWTENRIWSTTYRGPIAIHAGVGKHYLSALELKNYVTGAIVSVTEIVACVHLEVLREQVIQKGNFEIKGTPYTAIDILYHKHAEGPFCFVLANTRKLAQPIPCVGKQRIWNVPESIVNDHQLA